MKPSLRLGYTVVGAALFAAMLVIVVWKRPTTSAVMRSALVVSPQIRVSSAETVSEANERPSTNPTAREALDHLLKKAREETDPTAREALLDRAARGLPRGLYGELLKALGAPPPDSVEAEAQRAILLRWAWEEPTGAAAWALLQPPGALRREALGAAAARWTEQAPEQVLSWAANLDPAERDWVLLAGGDRLARTDPASFALWSRAMSPSRERERLTLQAAQLWAQKDPVGLIDAVAQHGGDDFAEWRRATTAGLVNQLAQIDGATAAQLVTEKIPPGPLQEAAATGVAGSWSQRDPASAAEWVDAFPSANLRATASALVVSNWLEHDRAAAERWANQLPRGVVSDAAAERVSQFLASRDPAAGIVWATRVDAKEMRDEAVRFVLAEWLQNHPDAGRAFLRSHPELASLAPE